MQCPGLKHPIGIALKESDESRPASLFRRRKKVVNLEILNQTLIGVEEELKNQILEIVKDLKASGLTQGVHFDFAFVQSHWDAMTGEIPKHTTFTFYEEKYSTLFALKYIS